MTSRASIGCAAPIIALFLAFEFLNFTGFCYPQFRYLGRQEMIDLAVQERLRGRPSNEIQYASLEDFYRRNPGCCELVTSGHFFESSIFSAFLAFTARRSKFCTK